ncbi:MAG TPA: hypothetical protein VLJ17_06065 [Xanthobacteraceae bacterium]|nr:hypothetical protein [Xanthobacteraceae bacterium]
MPIRLKINLPESATIVIVSQKARPETVAPFEQSRKTNFRYLLDGWTHPNNLSNHGGAVSRAAPQIS